MHGGKSKRKYIITCSEWHKKEFINGLEPQIYTLCASTWLVSQLNT